MVKAPADKEEAILSFAFFHLLRREFPSAQVNVIVDEENRQLFNFLLPLELQVFILPTAERSILKLHRFAANLVDVFNIDLFFDLEGSKSSASLGKFFRAEKSVGFDRGLVRYLYDVVSDRRDFVSLLEVYLAMDKSLILDMVRGGVSRPLKELINLPPYFVLFLDHLNDKNEFDFWVDFINSFEKRYFVLWRGEFDILVNDLEKELDHHKNDIRVLLDDSLIKTEQFLINSAAVFSNQRWPILLASYLALDSFYFDFSSSPLIRTPHFYAKPNHIELNVSPYLINGDECLDLVGRIEDICKL